MVKAQEYLNENYLKDQRENITELDISKKDLEGELDLSEFINLKKIRLFGKWTNEHRPKQ